MKSGQSQVILRSLCAYFVRQTEPKILRLVLTSFLFFHFRLVQHLPKAASSQAGCQVVLHSDLQGAKAR